MVSLQVDGKEKWEEQGVRAYVSVLALERGLIC